MSLKGYDKNSVVNWHIFFENKYAGSAFKLHEEYHIIFEQDV